jgi:hypothetical protein
MWNLVLPILIPIKKILDSGEEAAFFFLRKLRKNLRELNLGKKQPQGKIKIGILCVKNTVYAGMAIKNINSLHFLNQHYKCYIYCDRHSYEYLLQHRHELDYPKATKIMLKFKTTSQPWQKYKLDALQNISLLGGALVDADSRWFAEPLIDLTSAYFLTPIHMYKDDPQESKLAAKLLTKGEMKSFIHFATGFVFLPKEYRTKKFFRELDAIYKKVKTLTKNDEVLKRLNDEFAITILVQRHLRMEQVKVLKEVDGPGNRQLIQSYYYGCWNNISE